MSKGKVWPAEWKVYRDRITGVNVRQLTDYKAHSWHFYFTESGWYDGDRRLLFMSDRGNSTNLFSIDLESGEIVQLTAYPDNDHLDVCLHPSGTKAFIVVRSKVVALDLATLEERVLFECPADFRIGNVNCTADGKYAVTCLQEDLSHRIQIDLGNGYVGHRELMEASPISRIVTIDVESGESETVYEDRNFITHINTSPVKAELMTFCHEGPWHLVDHRIWGLDLRTGKAWKIRERLEPREKVGHEFFHADGIHIGYHGFREDGTNFFGKIGFDNTGMEEVEFPFDTWHAHTCGFKRAVVDGKGGVKTLNVWNRTGETFDGPRTLCELRCSFHSQNVHAHPRFTDDGCRLLFTSDRNGYGNIYLVDIPDDFTSLPKLEL
ncbi:oligogalacturonate lyase family protein [Paenibacillus solisilvae]|uniref:Oligogalacturonate lyase family protein n=1 Tax=Paenibacillus solisilvae TaxID=2486751 RepID=A0ABW0W4C0_9BACL